MSTTLLLVVADWYVVGSEMVNFSSMSSHSRGQLRKSKCFVSQKRHCVMITSLLHHPVNETDVVNVDISSFTFDPVCAVVHGVYKPLQGKYHRFRGDITEGKEALPISVSASDAVPADH